MQSAARSIGFSHCWQAIVARTALRVEALYIALLALMQPCARRIHNKIRKVRAHAAVKFNWMIRVLGQEKTCSNGYMSHCIEKSPKT